MSNLAWGRRLIRAAEGGFLVLATLGCLGLAWERSYGIMRQVTLSQMPDLSCMRRALEGIEGVRITDEFHDEIPATPGHAARFSFHSFDYEGEDEGASAGLRVDLSREGVLRLSHHRITFNERPPAAAIQSTRRLMLRVEQRLAEDCGMPELLSDVEENCKRVDCGE